MRIAHSCGGRFREAVVKHLPPLHNFVRAAYRYRHHPAVLRYHRLLAALGADGMAYTPREPYDPSESLLPIFPL